MYEHLIRGLKLDSLCYARTYNGKCCQLEMQNSLWVADRNFEEVCRLHGELYPLEPFRLCGLGSYAMCLLVKQLYQRMPSGP